MNIPVAIPQELKDDANGPLVLRDLILQLLAEGALLEAGNQAAVRACQNNQVVLFEELRDRYGRRAAAQANHYAVEAAELGVMPEELK